MKKTVLWIALGALLVLVVLGALVFGQRKADADAPDSDAQSGSAPNFTVTDTSGKTVDLSDFQGKPVVINFWATWCKYCVMEMPDFNKAHQEYPDVVFLMVNVTDGVYETPDKAKAYVEQEGYSFDIYFDIAGQAVKAYDVKGYPTTVFINANGDVVSQKSGMISYETLVQGIKLISE